MSFVLIVEPDEVNAARIRTILESVDKSFDYELVDTAEKAIEVVEHQKTDVFVGDMQMPVMTGTELFSMIEMISPDTVRIVMTDGGRIQETVKFMNECKTFKIIIKPCRVADDLLTPIHAALSYKASREAVFREMKEEYLGRSSTEQDYERMERAWRERLNNYQRVQNVFVQMLTDNLKIEGFGPKIRERLERWYQFIVEEYVHEVLTGSGDYVKASQKLLASFHDPKHGCTLRLKKSSEEEIDPNRMNEITYLLRVICGLCRDLQNEYQISAVIEPSEKAYILRIKFQLEKDADGNAKKRRFRVRDEKLRGALIRATEIGIDSFGYRSVLLRKETEDILNIAIPR